MFQITRARQELPSSHGAAAVAHASLTGFCCLQTAVRSCQAIVEKFRVQGCKVCSKSCKRVTSCQAPLESLPSRITQAIASLPVCLQTTCPTAYAQA